MNNIETMLESMRQHADDFRRRAEAIQEELSREHFDGKAGEGAVTALVNGLGKVIRVNISPAGLSRLTSHELGGFVLTAVIEARRRAAELRDERSRELTPDGRSFAEIAATW